MERIVITLDDDGTIDITAKSEGGDVETMEATDMEQAVDIVRDLLMDSQEDMQDVIDEMDPMDDDEMDRDMDMSDRMTPEEYEKSWTEEAEMRAKERKRSDSYT